MTCTQGWRSCLEEPLLETVGLREQQQGGRWQAGREREDAVGVISELHVGHWGEVAEGHRRKSSEE